MPSSHHCTKEDDELVEMLRVHLPYRFGHYFLSWRDIDKLDMKLFRRYMALRLTHLIYIEFGGCRNTYPSFSTIFFEHSRRVSCKN